jgi:putative transposase
MLRTWVMAVPTGPSLRAQCRLLSVTRSTCDYLPAGETPFNLELMGRIDRIHLEEPTYGVERMTVLLRNEGHSINQKRVRRLMRKMAIEPVYPKPRTSTPNGTHRIYPYLLRDLPILGPDEVWSADITYVPMARGFMYLVAVMDWFSRYVLSWAISNTMDTRFCLEALEEAVAQGVGRARIFNTDQGSQFTSLDFTAAVEAHQMLMSMDGKGRWMDNVFIERLWRSYKYEDVYLRSYADGEELIEGSGRWFDKYNRSRPHQALAWRTPHDVYFNRN